MSEVTVYESFDALPESCEAIFGRAGSGRDVFLSLPWFRNLAATTFGDRIEPRIYVVEGQDGSPSAALAMCRHTAQQGTLAALELSPAANFYSPLFGPLFAEGGHCTAGNLKALAMAVARDIPSWDTVDLHPMDAGSPLYNAILAAFRQAGMAVQSYFCFGNWYLDVNGRSYEQYLAGLPSKLRNTLKRKAKLLEAENGFHVEIISAPSEIERGISAYQKVYGSSWKIPEAFPDFIPGLIRTCAEQGWLRLGIAYVGNEPAAAQLWITDNGVASIYKLAYDDRFVKLSVGTVLTAHMMRHAIDVDRVREVDYLSGDDAYKQDWMSGRRERWGIRAFNLGTLRGQLSAVRHLGGRALRNFFNPHRRRGGLVSSTTRLSN